MEKQNRNKHNSFVKFSCVDNSSLKQHMYTCKINVAVSICVEADAESSEVCI